MATEHSVTFYRTYFREDEIVDGDYLNAPSTYTAEESHRGTAHDIATWIRNEGLRFDATGAAWAANPDGSYVADYGTGERCEVTAHLSNDIPARLANAIRTVVDVH